MELDKSDTVRKPLPKLRNRLPDAVTEDARTRWPLHAALRRALEVRRAVSSLTTAASSGEDRKPSRRARRVVALRDHDSESGEWDDDGDNDRQDT